jgi:hypothetical protein
VVTAEQHVPALHVAGVRQNERRQQYEHQDGDHQGPSARLDFPRDTAFGVFEVDRGHAQTNVRCRGLGGVGVTRAGATVGQHTRVRGQVVRRGVGDVRGDHVTGTHVQHPRREVHQPTVAGPATHSGGAGVFTAFPAGDQQLDGLPDLRAVLFQSDRFLHRHQPLVAFLHDGFR